MGIHAFTEMPGQAVRLQGEYPDIVNEGLYGFVQRWDLLVGVWRAREGFDAFYPENSHNTLSFIVSGASVERRDGRFAGQRGYADLNSFMLYAGGGARRYASRGDVRLCHIYFHPDLIRDIASMESDRDTGSLELRDDRIFARDLHLRSMADQYASRAADADAPPSLLEMNARAVVIGTHLLRRHSNRTPSDKPKRGALTPARLATALDFIEAHLGENVPLADMAKTIKLSQRHFCGAFRRSTGMTPHNYVTARRIERAKEMLAGPAPLAEIALACGFSSQQHFTTAVRRALGTTPGCLRASMRG